MQAPTTTQELQDTLDRIATAQNDLQALQAEQDAELISVRERFSDRIEALADEIKALVKLARPYVKKKQRALLGDRQSAETTLSQYGFQKGKPALHLIKGWSEADVIDALRDSERPHLAAAAIIVTEKLNRAALTTLTDDELADFGLHRKQTSNFYVLPKQDQGQRATA